MFLSVILLFIIFLRVEKQIISHCEEFQMDILVT